MFHKTIIEILYVIGPSDICIVYVFGLILFSICPKMEMPLCPFGIAVESKALTVELF